MLKLKSKIMKTKMKTLFLMPLLALLFLASCQDEVTEITPPDESEAIVANSNLVAMINATSKMDGSKDNIIDRANCLSVKFPVTVIVNNREEIDIYNYEDLRHIEIIFDEFEDDQDFVEIIFPIVVITDNHDEIVINNASELKELADLCPAPNESDDDIECIDFKYPISFSVYNANFQIIDVAGIENDRQLYRFIKRVMDADVLASLNFPVVMQLYDGSEEIVYNNLQLERVIEEAKDACDEDDDNDYNDDDFTKEYLDNYLKECAWYLNEFVRNDENKSELYAEFSFTFQDEGVVDMKTNTGEIVNGVWAIEMVSGRGAKLMMEFSNDYADFNLNWFVYEIQEGKIKIYTELGNRLILTRYCGTGDYECLDENATNTVTACLWKVNFIKRDGSDITNIYEDTRFKFISGGSFHRIINYGSSTEQTEADGQWTSVEQESECKIKIYGVVSTFVKGYWSFEFDSAEGILTLTIDENNYMILQKDCI